MDVACARRSLQSTHERSLLIPDDELDGIDRCPKVIVNQRTERRILSGPRFLPSVRRVLPEISDCRRLNREEVSIRCLHLLRPLGNRGCVVENPETSPVRSDDQVLLPRVDREIVVERRGQAGVDFRPFVAGRR